MASQGSGSSQGDPLSRRAELAGRLDRVRSRIGAACAAAGRDESELTLIAVTKTYPASDVLALAGLGLRDFGENRDQEAGPKAAEVAAGGGDRPAIRWHFIGQLQTNKAHRVARYADVVQSVDRLRLVHALGTAARAAERELTCLVQVSLDPADAGTGAGSGEAGDQARGGVPPARLAEVAAAVEAEPGLILGGLMAVAPLDMDPVAAFAPLRDLGDVVRSVRDSAAMISAGMSGDLEAAIAAGATHLRIGTALLGNRSVPVR
ncbi:MAG TPA: YggS family pyridoxal phosphate-dependent enzyme [Trebonia sp.]|nr:YggS family pyridoxal phosphate-dependent enzyme [Trebonia sp.]